MTTEEFSDQFDVLLNSYNAQAEFGEGASRQTITLDEYEKSVLLTAAQDAIVKSYFDNRLNQQGQGIDDSIRRQVDFSTLIKVMKYSRSLSVLQHDDNRCYDDRGLLVNLGETQKILYILNERLEVSNSSGKDIYVVVPINYREYDREMSKAYGQPLKKQAWRLFSSYSTGYDIVSELIPAYGTIASDSTSVVYVVRYVKRPAPIILRDLSDDLSIDGETIKTECSLHPILHKDILNKAFELAVTTRGGGSVQQPSNGQ